MPRFEFQKWEDGREAQRRHDLAIQKDRDFVARGAEESRARKEKRRKDLREQLLKQVRRVNPDVTNLLSEFGKAQHPPGTDIKVISPGDTEDSIARWDLQVNGELGSRVGLHQDDRRIQIGNLYRDPQCEDPLISIDLKPAYYFTLYEDFRGENGRKFRSYLQRETGIRVEMEQPTSEPSPGSDYGGQ